MFTDVAARDGASAVLTGCVCAMKGEAVGAGIAAMFIIGQRIDAASGALDLTFRAAAIVNAVNFTA